MELKLLFIEDDPEWGTKFMEIFSGESILNYELRIQVEESFERGQKLISRSDFDVVILDLFKDGNQQDEEAGVKVLETIRNLLFVPVIFFTGHAYKIESYKSEVIGVVNKGDGIGALFSEIERIIKSKLALIKKNITQHINSEIKQYFWETVDKQKNVFASDNIDYSLGYLILRRIATSLSKDNIKAILGDDKIREEKVHPMEFYLFPPSNGEYESCEILKNESEYFVLLTPSCDFIERGNKGRKAQKVLLAQAMPIELFGQFEAHKAKNNNESKNKLRDLLTNNHSDRYFFLPQTPFINNLVVDFQLQTTINYEELKNYNRIAKLDDPFGQSMISSFIRYYNRIGSPDIDVDYILERL